MDAKRLTDAELDKLEKRLAEAGVELKELFAQARRANELEAEVKRMREVGEMRHRRLELILSVCRETWRPERKRLSQIEHEAEHCIFMGAPLAPSAPATDAHDPSRTPLGALRWLYDAVEAVEKHPRPMGDEEVCASYDDARTNAKRVLAATDAPSPPGTPEDAKTSTSIIWKDAEAIGWPEDWPHENGRYFTLCRICGKGFLGHKRRFHCKPCTEAAAKAVDAMAETEAQS